MQRARHCLNFMGESSGRPSLRNMCIEKKFLGIHDNINTSPSSQPPDFKPVTFQNHMSQLFKIYPVGSASPEKPVSVCPGFCCKYQRLVAYKQQVFIAQSPEGWMSKIRVQRCRFWSEHLPCFQTTTHLQVSLGALVLVSFSGHVKRLVTLRPPQGKGI